MTSVVLTKASHGNDLKDRHQLQGMIAKTGSVMIVFCKDVTSTARRYADPPKLDFARVV